MDTVAIPVGLPDKPPSKPCGGLTNENRGKGSKRGRRNPSKLLQDMRFVYGNEEGRDKTPGQRAVRTMLKEDPKGFINQLGSLEKAHRSGKVKAEPAAAIPKRGDAGSSEEDEGSARCLGLVNRLLAEFERNAEQKPPKSGYLAR